MMEKKVDPFYKSQAWLKIRARVLKRDKYECQVCKRDGRHAPADTVHHIFPLEEFPQYKLKSWNLISVNKLVHNSLHERGTNALTDLGVALLTETAEKQGVPNPYGPQTILVIGMPGAGKTTYVQKHMTRNSICYDLDYIAAALRVTTPDKIEHPTMADPARRMANDLFKGFTEGAHRFARTVYIIRSAPTEDEYHIVRPTKLVIARGGYGNRNLTDERRHSIASRIKQCEDTARAEGIEVEEVGLQI